ncbi:hypothetical protein HMH01_11710 [Halovulum dunhuangense]|uniref:BASS family bile acid:Na+ symporter n=1 Tax=Halovulum dunhuangense TaxID=1505036 RepID=A0A849L4M7_9RHOB|nr:hypothetical protein [Halovulum dunhuangense]NNU81101.1 hypothetical protein [Halovulum dunhuangense]
MLIGFLARAGRNARWILSIGSVVALFTPGLAEFLRPALPALVSMVYALAMARIDLGATLRAAIRPRRLAQLAGIAVLLLPVTALVYGLVGRAFGPEVAATLVYVAAAPPIASCAGLCFLLGFNARLALEVTVATTLMTPVLGPLAVAIALPGAEAALEPLALAQRLFLMILGGILGALLIRRLVGAGRIAASGQVFDGVAAFGMLLFVFPLFDRVGALILEDPGRAMFILVLGFVLNIGANLATRAALGSRLPAAEAGAAGILMGNRTIAMYLAALPFEPVLALFVALYQYPMYFTPLLLARLRIPPAA